MPIRRELRPLYPRNWAELSFTVRFEIGQGRCRRCARPHKQTLRVLPDGRWWDEEGRTWRGPRGQPARWPDLVEATAERRTRVVLAAAHLDGNPRNNRMRNLSGLCQRCHMMHDRAQHRWSRWVTVRRRYADGDLFLGWYRELVAVRTSPVRQIPRREQVTTKSSHRVTTESSHRVRLDRFVLDPRGVTAALDLH